MISLQVYDYDWAFRDDFMGEASVPLSRLEMDKAADLTLSLAEAGKSEYLGQLAISLRLEAVAEPHNLLVRN